uniref:Uncharacterized protein n=1 Tax=Oryza nivara TaxID=4536 RepID=A0A0E0JBU4_ORYNI
MASPRAQLSRQKGVGSVDGRIEQSYQGCGAGQKLKQEVAALVMPTRELTATSFINPILKVDQNKHKIDEKSVSDIHDKYWLANIINRAYLLAIFSSNFCAVILLSMEAVSFPEKNRYNLL